MAANSKIHNQHKAVSKRRRKDTQNTQHNSPKGPVTNCAIVRNSIQKKLLEPDLDAHYH